MSNVRVYLCVYWCVCVCVKGGGVAGQKHKRFIFAPSFCQHSRWALSLRLVLNAYTKLIKIQLGKKFSSLSNKYCKICRQADSTLPRPLYRVNTANAFAFALASMLVSFWQSRARFLSFPCGFICHLTAKVFCVCLGFSPSKVEGSKKRIDRARRGRGRKKESEGELNLRASKAPLIISAVRTINLALRLYKIYQTGNTGNTWGQYNSDIYLDFIYLWKIEYIKKTTCFAWLQRTKGGNVCVIKLMSKGREKGEEEEGLCVVWHIKLLSLPSMQSGAI